MAQLAVFPAFNKIWENELLLESLAGKASYATLPLLGPSPNTHPEPAMVTSMYCMDCNLGGAKQIINSLKKTQPKVPGEVSGTLLRRNQLGAENVFI